MIRKHPFLFWMIELQLIATAFCLSGLYRDSWPYRLALECGGFSTGGCVGYVFYKHKAEKEAATDAD